MKGVSALLLTALLLCCACTTAEKVHDTESGTHPAQETTAAFKKIKKLDNENWLLIFRRIDNCRYILFPVDNLQLFSFPYDFLLLHDNVPKTNIDYINIKFDISYISDIVSEAPDNGEDSETYGKLINLKRSETDRFKAAGFEKDQEAENFIMLIKDMARNDEKEYISALISYPLTVTINKRKIKISDKDDFIKNYHHIFNKKVKDSLLLQPLADIQANSKGIMIGSGELWINMVNSRIMITSVNNI
jgi:hypothetical protein